MFAGKRQGIKFTAVAVKKEALIPVIIDKTTISNVQEQTKVKNDIVQSSVIVASTKEIAKRKFSAITLFCFIILITLAIILISYRKKIAQLWKPF